MPGDLLSGLLPMERVVVEILFAVGLFGLVKFLENRLFPCKTFIEEFLCAATGLLLFDALKTYSPSYAKWTAEMICLVVLILVICFILLPCSFIGILDVAAWLLSRVARCVGEKGDMFYKYSGSLKKEIDLTDVDTSKAKYMAGMFSQNPCLETIRMGNIDTSHVKNMGMMFSSCSSLATLDLSRFDTGNVTNMSLMFEYCKNLKSLDLSAFRTSSVETMRDMFNGCWKLKEIKLPEFDTSNVTDMRGMFQDCCTLGQLDLSHFDTSKVTDMREMFKNCYNLRTIGEETVLDLRSVRDYRDMFLDCQNLVGLKLRNAPEDFDYEMAGLREGQFTMVDE